MGVGTSKMYRQRHVLYENHESRDSHKIIHVNFKVVYSEDQSKMIIVKRL